MIFNWWVNLNPQICEHHCPAEFLTTAWIDIEDIKLFLADIRIFWSASVSRQQVILDQRRRPNLHIKCEPNSVKDVQQEPATN